MYTWCGLGQQSFPPRNLDFDLRLTSASFQIIETTSNMENSLGYFWCYWGERNRCGWFEERAKGKKQIRWRATDSIPVPGCSCFCPCFLGDILLFFGISYLYFRLAFCYFQPESNNYGGGVAASASPAFYWVRLWDIPQLPTYSILSPLPGRVYTLSKTYLFRSCF